MKFSIKIPKTFDWLLYIIPLLLSATGIAVIYSITYYNDKISLFHGQMTYLIIGTLVMIILTFFDYRHLKGISPLLYIIGIGLLFLVLEIGKSTFGATRWIDLGFFNFQPSEFFKLFTILILARFLGDKIGKINYKQIIFALLIGIIPALLILKQPDLGSFSVVVVITIGMIFFAKLNSKQLTIMIIAGLLVTPLIWTNLKPYQKERIHTFINPTSDQFGSGYNVLQSTIAVGNGGIMGKGLGHGAQSQLNFLPVAHTDFIFAGLAEASGFVGSVFVVILFLVLILRIAETGHISKDNFGMFFAYGVAIMMLFQVFVNIGMNIGIVPITGIPLPFLSHGGSSMMLNMICIGILQSIYLRHKKITF
ncbi:MAG: hypothetical protein ACD_58C00283G0001 [uncultured bacterium]|nr:MAG: hypothetical protein ACD_58C00283G0001 [uncultured bacterium]